MDNERGLFGNDLQRRLQAAALAAAGEYRDTPGAVFAARMAGTDDPKKFGWDRIEGILRNEGAITFRMIPINRCAQIEQRLAEIGCTISWWDVFDGPSDEIRAACERIVNRPREDFVLIEPSASDDAAFFECAQAFMAECGVAPYPTQVLSGGLGPVAFAVLLNPEDGSVVATAFSYFPYNRHSTHRKSAWAGLVAVRDDLRGRGLGAFVNALVLKKAVEEMGAERIQEFARTSNVASCKMIEHCGLSLRTDVRSGIAQPVEAESFTR
ncbi:Acetyltransferase (GNAT) family protein [Tropicimonas sediminicola]|uniref:Acetyltransferase (GNAT) family protein n=1 Tax=Tropicimonas sediminicola TaxID=1031541 RepID=A0A239MJ67_9RHOB|nr:Acetyltransferase (GNAT) family protein [Tropicimonas sediminicola]